MFNVPSSMLIVIGWWRSQPRQRGMRGSVESAILPPPPFTLTLALALAIYHQLPLSSHGHPSIRNNSESKETTLLDPQSRES